MIHELDYQLIADLGNMCKELDYEGKNVADAINTSDLSALWDLAEFYGLDSKDLVDYAFDNLLYLLNKENAEKEEEKDFILRYDYMMVFATDSKQDMLDYIEKHKGILLNNDKSCYISYYKNLEEFDVRLDLELFKQTFID